MKLYELKERRSGGGLGYKVAVDYFTAQAKAQSHLVETRKAGMEPAKAAEQKSGVPVMWTLELNQVELKTNLVAAEWCQILASDAPGFACELTPQDLIQSRKRLALWEFKGAGK